MRQYPIELEAKVAAQNLLESAIILNATLEGSEHYPYRREAFEEALDKMERVLRMRIKAASKRAA
ncbi:hypothetical protein NO932_06425 [Pelagibacterium sp. 26DY04]|uniref:hypothetical protein n=1 Tax=Pelagibacterium sp. 26DY04 TaxID=2967130 RepID=UPI0028154A47|nr:hypothetical protein [Pelagibacterium sp. 26DY04]WMT88240.1 hypothetical protein NO932_06425 [Pelagibacterium sp. 26DY04]